MGVFMRSNDNKKLCHILMGSALCSPVPMFPGTDVPRSYVPRYRCSPVPMFPGTYVPRYLCSPVPMVPEPMFPGTYVPRYRCSPNLCSPVPMFPDLLQISYVSKLPLSGVNSRFLAPSRFPDFHLKCPAFLLPM